MKQSLAKLTLTPLHEGKAKHTAALIEPGKSWWTATDGCSPNDWSVRVIFAQSLQPDNTVEATVDFLMPSAEYLLKPGAKFMLFGAGSGYEWRAEILSVIS